MSVDLTIFLKGRILTLKRCRSVLRSKDLVIRGSGLGSFSVRDFAKELEPLVKACVRIQKQKIKVCKLSDVERMWNEEGERVVFVP